jgi:hypothetical protein
VRLTEDRRSHLIHVMMERIWKDDLVDFPDEAEALREAKRVLQAFARDEEEADRIAREKISRLSRRVPEGGREWDVLYRKHHEEEMAKRRP